MEFDKLKLRSKRANPLRVARYRFRKPSVPHQILKIRKGTHTNEYETSSEILLMTLRCINISW